MPSVESFYYYHNNSTFSFSTIWIERKNRVKKSLFYCKGEKVRLNRQENWISPFLTPKTFDKIVCVVHFLFYYVGIFSLLLFREKPHTDFCGLPYKIRETFLHIAIGDLKDEFLLIIITICSTAVFVEL